MNTNQNPEIITEDDIEIPEPEFVGMSWPEITEILDEQEREWALTEMDRERYWHVYLDD